MTNRTKQKAYGRWNPQGDPVLSRRVNEHVRMLHDMGMSYRAISGAAGIDINGILGHVHGRYEHWRQPVADRVLAVRFDPHLLPPQSLLPSRASRRRLQALATLGWRIYEISDMTGISRGQIGKILHPDRQLVSAKFAALISDIYDELSGTAAPDDPGHEERRNVARTRGWVPPLGWDDIDFDDAPVLY